MTKTILKTLGDCVMTVEECFQLLDMASKLGPALQVGEGLVWKPPAESAPEAASGKPPATSVEVARQMDSEISRGGAAYVAQDATAAANDGNNNNNNDDSSVARSDVPATGELEKMGLDRKDFENLDQESSVDHPPPNMAPPVPSEALYAIPMKREGLGLGGGLPPLRGGLGVKGGLPSLADLPPLPTEDPEDDDESEIEEEIEAESKRRALPAM